MTIPRILLVDDERQVSHMLRSSLEYSGQEFVVVDVPSGEEALLELARGPVDLLVADLRLPGMTGFELLEQVQKQNPSARAIMITGQPTEEAKEKAKELGVIAFLAKPIRTSYFLEAVNRGLQGRTDAPPAEGVLEEEKAFMAEWLLSMQKELGAEATLLLDNRGEIVVEAGDLANVDMNATMPSLMAAYAAGVKISRMLDCQVPGNFQYFEGDEIDFYLASVGAYYALVILFKGKQPVDQMSAVVHYCRRTANDLLVALYNIEKGLPVPSPPQTPEVMKKLDSEKVDGSPPDATDLESAAGSLDKQDAEDFWDQAVSEGASQADGEGEVLTYEEARQRGLLSEEAEE
jgi:CheY-like chemotaxis protein